MACELFLEMAGTGFRLELRGELQEALQLLRELLPGETKLLEYLARRDMPGGVEAAPPGPEATPAPAEQPVAPTPEREPEAAARAAPVPELAPPSAAALRQRFTLRGKKETAAFAVYYLDVVCKRRADASAVRRLIKEELGEDTMLKSLATYLKRAQSEGWIALDGETWRMTRSGLEEVQRWLGGAQATR